MIKLKNGYYDSEGRLHCKSLYDHDKFEKQLMAHFLDGGSEYKSAIAGVIGVSAQTVRNWMNPNHDNFKEEFKCMVDRLAPKAVAKLDEWHRHAASGRLKVKGGHKFDSSALNRRAAHSLGLTDKIETSQEIKNDPKSMEEILRQIEEVEQKIKDSSDK
jgi:transposase